MFNDPLVDGHEVQADFNTEIQAEADSGLPQLCQCGELAQDCDCAEIQFPKITAQQTRQAIAKSNTYKIQIRAIRSHLHGLDEKPEMPRQDRFDYEALEAKEKAILKNWKLFRARNGLSNEAVS